MKQSNQNNFLHALWVSFLPLMLLPSLSMTAQQENYSATFTTSKPIGEQIEFGFIAKNASKISIDGVAEPPSRTNSGSAKYTLTKQTITIQGELSHLFLLDAMLTKLDVTKMPSLVNLNCSKNQLTALDISNCSKLNSFQCFRNKLKDVKGLSSAKMLQRFICYDNLFSSLELPNTNTLYFIDCSKNNLSSLDLSKTPGLKTLSCSKNKLNALDLSEVPLLEALSCGDNQLKGLDLSNVKNLVYLECHQNQIKGIGMTHMINTLPEAKTEGHLVLVSSENVNDGNVATKEDVALARSRKWKVCNDNQEVYDGVDTYVVTLSPIKEGGVAQIIGAEDLEKVLAGTELTITATPNEGYQLSKIIAGNEDITTSKKFIVKQATEVKVTFKKITNLVDIPSGKLQLYPNPTSHKLYIRGIAPCVPVNLFSIAGNAIIVTRSSDLGTVDMDLSNLAEGVYLVQIEGQIYRVLVLRK